MVGYFARCSLDARELGIAMDSTYGLLLVKKDLPTETRVLVLFH
jgi:hypothetical protein